MLDKVYKILDDTESGCGYCLMELTEYVFWHQISNWYVRIGNLYRLLDKEYNGIRPHIQKIA